MSKTSVFVQCYKTFNHQIKPVFDEERRFSGEEDDDVEQVFPVRADGVAGHVRREVDVGAGDDVQKLSVMP